MKNLNEFVTKKMAGSVKLLAVFLSLSFGYAWAQGSHGGGTLKFVEEEMFKGNLNSAIFEPSDFVELLGQTNKLQRFYSQKMLKLDNDGSLSIYFKKSDGQNIRITTVPSESNALKNNGIMFGDEIPVFVSPDKMVSMLAHSQQSGYDQTSFGELFVNQIGDVPVLVIQKNVGGVIKAVAILPDTAKKAYDNMTSLDIIEETRPTGF
ncbi:MAG: hypothetical protein KBD78_07520 [Oligoflexales bacterium]|nr:hypothetical protein [Oligoflexales bacterium]